MKKLIMFFALLSLLFALPATAAPLTNAEVPGLLEKLLPKAEEIFYLWNGGVNFAEGTNINPDSIQGEYGMLAKSFPYKTVQALINATREIYSKNAYSRYLRGVVPTFKEADGRLWSVAGGYDGQLNIRWITKSALIAQQDGDKAIIKCTYKDGQSGAQKTGYLDLANENGKWKLDSHINIPMGAPNAKNRNVWYDEELKETTDHIFHVAPMLGDENRPELLAAYVCLGFWDTSDYSKPTPYIQWFVNKSLTGKPDYFLEGTKIFVVIPRYKDTIVTVELIDHPGKKPLFTGVPGKTLVFAGNTPRNTKNLLPMYQITIKRGNKSVTFIPDINFKTGRPMVKPDKRLLDLTPPESVG